MPGNTTETVGSMPRLGKEHQEAALKLDNFLTTKKRSRGRKSPSAAEYTLSRVNLDAAKILEELLVRQLAMKDNTGSPIGHEYQRVEEVDVVEEDADGNQLSPLDHEMDSFPYADGTPTQQIRSKSLPANTKRSIIHDQRHSEENILGDSDILPKSTSYSHNGGEKLPSKLPSDKKSISSPTVSSHSCTPKSGDLLDLHRYIDKGQISHSTTPSPLDGYSHSDSSSTEGSKYSLGRRKKSVFKRAKERLIHVLRKKDEKDGKKNEKDKDTKTSRNEKSDKKKKLKKKKHSVSDRSTCTSGEILEETHTHKRTHIKQSHGDASDHTLIRIEDTVETTDISEPAKSSKKHIKKTKKIKESTSGSFANDGIAGTLKRLTSFRKGSKKKHSGGKYLFILIIISYSDC